MAYVRRYNRKKGAVCNKIGCDNPSVGDYAWSSKRINLCRVHLDECRAYIHRVNKICYDKKESPYKKTKPTRTVMDISPAVMLATLHKTYGAPERFARLCEQYIRENL